MNHIILFFRFLKNHFGKIILTALFCALFVVLLFPFGDLSDYISSEVSARTNNQVYLQFDELHLNPFSPSLTMENVLIETPQIDGLKVKQLTAAPSIMALISQTIGGKITAEGIWSGDAYVKVSSLSGKSQIEAALSKISLNDLRTALKLPLPISGQLNLNTSAAVDLSFAEQPDGELTAQIQKFELAAANIMLADLGNLSVPEIKFSNVDLKSKFQAGKLIIENLKLGSASDDLSGSIKGDVSFVIRNLNGQILPFMSGYNLSIDLTAKPAFKDRASFFLSFIDQYQSADANGTRYRFKLVSLNPNLPPQFSPIQ